MNYVTMWVLAFSRTILASTDAIPSSSPVPMCPVGCSCAQAFTVIDCPTLDHIPEFQNRSLIKELSITQHSLTELGEHTLDGFTTLVHLDLSTGNISKVHVDAFSDIKATVTRINLSQNEISAIPANTFKDFPSLLNLELNQNPLKVVTNNSLVNMPKLMYVYLHWCKLNTVETLAFQDLPSLQELYLGENHLTEIPFHALKSVPSLRFLSLSFNSITRVPSVVPYVLPHLESLSLDSNDLSFVTFPNVSSSLIYLDLGFTELTSISEESWKRVPSLETLDISGVKIPEIKKGMFHGMPKLLKLYFKSSRYIQSVGEYGFDGLSSVKKIDLSNNHNLTKVHVTAFRNTSLDTLFLDGTGLRTFQEDLVPWSAMEMVNLDNTPLMCDCRIQWMLNTTITGTYKTVTDRLTSLKCKSPPLLANKEVGTIPLRALSCMNPGEKNLNTTGSRTMTGIIVAATCTATIAIIMLLLKFRNRIIMSMRRYFQYRRYKNDMVFMVQNDTAVGELEDSDGRPMKEMRLETVPLTY